MVEVRRLTNDEIERLVKEAPASETRNLEDFINTVGVSASMFFDLYGVDHFGLVSNGKPLYLAVLTQDDNKDYEFWTIVNREIKETFSLCKHVKRNLMLWLKRYPVIYATMEKINPKNMEWVEWLGFKKFKEDSRTITYCIKGA